MQQTSMDYGPQGHLRSISTKLNAMQEQNSQMNRNSRITPDIPYLTGQYCWARVTYPLTILHHRRYIVPHPHSGKMLSLPSLLPVNNTTEAFFLFIVHSPCFSENSLFFLFPSHSSQHVVNNRALSRENLSSGFFDQVRLKPVCSAEAAS